MIITISGACHSGKTTFGKKLEDEIDGAKFYNEIVRTHKFNSIDELRKNQNKYFEFEIKVINEKIEQERRLSNEPGIHILDRNLIDNLYYYLRFINESELTDKNKKEYNKFLIKIIDLSQKHFEEIYDEIIIIEPLQINNKIDDSYRPDNLKDIQESEYKLIKLFTFSFLNNINNRKVFTIKSSDEKQVKDYIKYLKNIKEDKNGN